MAKLLHIEATPSSLASNSAKNRKIRKKNLCSTSAKDNVSGHEHGSSGSFTRSYILHICPTCWPALQSLHLASFIASYTKNCLWLLLHAERKVLQKPNRPTAETFCCCVTLILDVLQKCSCEWVATHAYTPCLSHLWQQRRSGTRESVGLYLHQRSYALCCSVKRTAWRIEHCMANWTYTGHLRNLLCNLVQNLFCSHHSP